jgi:hypothetical protein
MHFHRVAHRSRQQGVSLPCVDEEVPLAGAY